MADWKLWLSVAFLVALIIIVVLLSVFVRPADPCSQCEHKNACIYGFCVPTVGQACTTSCINSSKCLNGICVQNNETPENMITKTESIQVIQETTKGLESIDFEDETVIDAVTYLDGDIYLLKDGTIHERKRVIESNVQLVRLAVFRRLLLGLGKDGILYLLNNKYYNTDSWYWQKVSWVNTTLTHISACHDGSCLWLQNDVTGYLYDQVDNLVSTVEMHGQKRTYGRDRHKFFELNGSIIYYEGNRYYGRYGLLTLKGELLVDNNVPIVMLNYEPIHLNQ